jgi:hypothetical protein
MGNQDLIRNRVNEYIKSTGVTAKWVADHCNIPVDIMSRFRSNKKDLYKESLETLERYLNEHNAL